LFNRKTSLSFDPLAVAETAADMPLSFLFNAERLNRMVQQKATGNGLGADEMISVLISKTWKAAPLQGLENMIQKQNQQLLLTYLLSLSISDKTSFATKAVINKALNDIKQIASAKLNSDDDVDGILVQLPLPKQVNEEKIINLINPDKDVDGFHPVSIGKMVQGLPTFIPATPYGIILMLEHYKIETSGKHAVVIGRSNIVGRPISILLSRNAYPGNCTVTVCHSRTKNLKEICLQADIIVAALGIPEFLKADMVKENAVVVDVGITRVQDASKKSGFAIKGDVDFANVAPKCSYITPVPGGVGLMTIAALLMNTFTACENKYK